VISGSGGRVVEAWESAEVHDIMRLIFSFVSLYDSSSRGRLPFEGGGFVFSVICSCTLYRIQTG
jgi:hypothetical protein